MNTYPNQTAAQIEAIKQNKDHKPTEFCPLIKDTCRKDCVCFQKAFERRMSDGKWSIFGLVCNNAMFEEHYIQQ